MSSMWYPLFEHLSREHGLTCLESELDEIARKADESRGVDVEKLVTALRFIASKSQCECWRVPGMGSGLDYEWMGCDPHHQQEMGEWCLTCVANEALKEAVKSKL